MGEPSLRDLFHLVKRVIPEDQTVVSVRPDTTVADALTIMRDNNFSRLPVTVGEEVLGVFSYRSFGLKLPDVQASSRRSSDPLSLHVDLFLESPGYARSTDEIPDFFDMLDTQGAVLVGSPEELIAVVTTADALAYFYEAAAPYYLLGEIELAMRELMRASASTEQLAECIEASLKQFYEDDLKRPLPATLEELGLSDLVTILRYRGTWAFFEEAFGNSQDYATAKLARMPDLRNDVFHFKRDLGAEDREAMQQCRDWLLTRVTQADARSRERDAET